VGGLKKFLNRAPRVRFRTKQDRRLNQLAELVVMNEKLRQWDLVNSGDFNEEEDVDVIECRTKVEFLKTRKENWEAIYESVSSHETEATLADVERIDTKVESVLGESQENLSVSDAASQLVALQAELKQAHERIHLSQARLGFLSERLSELKSEADLYEDAEACAVGDEELEGGADDKSWGEGASGEGNLDLSKLPLASATGTTKTSLSAAEFLTQSFHSSNLETNTWYPVCLSESIKSQETLVPFNLKGQPWVLFMNNEGKVGCIKDTCSHRACPLSLGKVNKDTGCIQCPYHGWEYDKDGKCTDMPSTNINSKGRAKMNVDSLRVSTSNDGILWVTDRESESDVGPPILTDLDKNDCLVQAFVDDIPMRSESVIDIFTINMPDLAQEVFQGVMDWTWKSAPALPLLAVGFRGLDPGMTFELKFVSHYAFKIEVKDGTGAQTQMLFVLSPVSTKKTNMIFQVWTTKESTSRWGTFLNRGWEEHIQQTLRDMLASKSPRQLSM